MCLIQDIIGQYPDWEGCQVLEIMRQAPNQAIAASVVQNALSQHLTLSEAQHRQYHESCIPLTDSRTLRDVNKRIKQLIAMKAHALADNPASDTSKMDVEISQLKKYHKECRRPGGIKNTNDNDRMAYRRFYAALNRLLKKAEADGHHEAAALIKQQLRLGKQMIWIETIIEEHSTTK